MDKATVSVIITCFNLEGYIGDAIRSVFKQDWAGTCEIVVVDDCSTDSSADVIQSFPHVRYVRTRHNAGVLLATLLGIDQTSGDVIFFLDGDDVWEPSKLRLSIEALERDPKAVMVTHDVAYADSDGRLIDQQSRPSAVLDPLHADEWSKLIIAGLCRQDDYIWLGSAWGVRRKAAKVKAFANWAKDLPDPANTYQDWPLAIWAASLPGARAAYVPEKLFRYRLHGSNYSGDASDTNKATRNFRRAHNTLAAMHSLAVDRQLQPDVVLKLRRRTRAYAYLSCLYSGAKTDALSLFPGAVADFWKSKRLGRELARLAIVLLLGPYRFTRLLGRS